MSRLFRFQKVSFWVGVVCAGLGLVTSSGCSPFPTFSEQTLWFLHPTLFLLGCICGYLSVLRVKEIDRDRWTIAEDPSLTSGEREYAHKYAERERRWAAAAFGAAPLMVGYWWAYQVSLGNDRLTAHLLPVTGIVGFAVGLVVGKIKDW